VGEGQVQDLVVVLRQGLHLLTGDAVVQALELPVPRHGGTWVSRHCAGDAVVAVEQLSPQELISGDSQPLSTGKEDLQHQAVWQGWATLHADILRIKRCENNQCSCRFVLLIYFFPIN
uniref:Uncharacterized protein n=1 Tax=Gadus morhua TaxID=8049 RepID=A0A8C5BB71_GADMO